MCIGEFFLFHHGYYIIERNLNYHHAGFIIHFCCIDSLKLQERKGRKRGSWRRVIDKTKTASLEKRGFFFQAASPPFCTCHSLQIVDSLSCNRPELLRFGCQYLAFFSVCPLFILVVLCHTSAQYNWQTSKTQWMNKGHEQYIFDSECWLDDLMHACLCS